MQSENRILGNQLVVMSREDLDALVNEMTDNYQLEKFSAFSVSRNRALMEQAQLRDRCKSG